MAKCGRGRRSRPRLLSTLEGGQPLTGDFCPPPPVEPVGEPPPRASNRRRAILSRAAGHALLLEPHGASCPRQPERGRRERRESATPSLVLLKRGARRAESPRRPASLWGVGRAPSPSSRSAVLPPGRSHPPPAVLGEGGRVWLCPGASLPPAGSVTSGKSPSSPRCDSPLYCPVRRCPSRPETLHAQL